jgi:hypothetical protein
MTLEQMGRYKCRATTLPICGGVWTLCCALPIARTGLIRKGMQTIKAKQKNKRSFRQHGTISSRGSESQKQSRILYGTLKAFLTDYA